MALRFDVGRLDRARRTGAGGARVHGSLGRTGVQIYHDASGREIREYRSPEEVFAPETLASLGGIPVTIGHPGAVSAANWRDVARGHVSDAPPGRRQDGPLEWLESQVVISDAPTLQRVDAGELVELSLGYSADVVDQPGVAPNGERYDRVQKNIRFNHLALLQDGRARAGRGARLRLDGNQEPTPTARADQAFAVGDRVEVVGKPHMPGADGPGTVEIVDGNAYGIRFDKMPNEIHKWYVAEELRTTTSKAKAMTMDQARLDGTAPKQRVKVDGIDCEVGSDTHVQMLERRAELASKRADELEAKLTAANAEIGTLKAKADAAPPAPDVNALVQDELAFRDSMRPLLAKDYAFAGKSREQVRLDAVGAETAAKAKALPEAQREGYLLCAIQNRLDAAEKPTHQPAAPAVKADASEPKRYDPFAIYNNAFNASRQRAEGKA